MIAIFAMDPPLAENDGTAGDLSREPRSATAQRGNAASRGAVRDDPDGVVLVGWVAAHASR